MSQFTAGLPPRYDALAPEVVLDPYPTYRRLREAGPLCRVGPGSWGVTRHADVSALMRDPRLSHDFPEEYLDLSINSGPSADMMRRVLTRYEPPEHTRLRKLIGGAFSPTLVRRLSAELPPIVDGLLDAALERGEFDAVTDFALPLTVSVIATFIGLPVRDVSEIPRATEFGRAAAPFMMVEEGGASAIDDAVTGLRELISARLDVPDRAVGDDLISRMVAARDGGDRLTRQEIVDNAVLTFFAGFETSLCLIGTGCAALLEHHDQLALLRADRSLIPRAIEEFLRFEAPIQGSPRVAIDNVEVGGRTIRKGRIVLLMLGSANRDETVFADPDRLDVTRNPNPHVAFGGGPHFCLGSSLSRAEAAVVFDRLLARCGRMEAAGEAVREPSSSFRSWASVPVSVGR